MNTIAPAPPTAPTAEAPALPDLRVVAHPLRIEILERVVGSPKGQASPSELAKALGVPLTNVAYHVRELLGGGLLREAETVPRRGALEHFYAVDVEGFWRLQRQIAGFSSKMATIAFAAEEHAGAPAA